MVLLPVLLPVIFALAGVVALNDGAPFFRHRRVGKGGRAFRCCKIRTMAADAQEHLAHYLDENPAAAKEWVLEHKLDHDPRIIKLGRFLRWSSLDELPQILNVLRGEMSFVGPRPVEPEELRRYGLSAGIYKSLRPGITGKRRVSGRSNVVYDKRVASDVAYAK